MSQLWHKGKFIYYLLVSVWITIIKVCCAWIITQFYRVSIVMGASHGILKSGMTTRFFKQMLRETGLLEMKNDVVQVEWKDIQCGAMGSVCRALFRYTNLQLESHAHHNQAKVSSVRGKLASLLKQQQQPTISTSIQRNRPLFSTYNHSLLPRSVIVKTCGEKTHQIIAATIADITTREHMIIATLSTHERLRDFLPAIFGVYYNSCGLLTTVMEDYGELRHVNSASGATMSDLCSMMNTLGNFHAQSWNDRRLLEQFRFTDRVQWVDLGFPSWAAKARSGPFKDLFSTGNLSIALDWLCDLDKMNELMMICRGYEIGGNSNNVCNPCVLAHGDFRLDNCFFDDVSRRCLMVDWQICGPRHPVADIVWALGDAVFEIVEDSAKLRQIIDNYVTAVLKARKKLEASMTGADATAVNLSAEDIMKMLPFGCMYSVYLLVIVALGAVEEGLIGIIRGNLTRCEKLFSSVGIPKFSRKVPKSTAPKSLDSGKGTIKSVQLSRSPGRKQSKR